MKHFYLSFLILISSIEIFAGVNDHTDPHGNGFRLNLRFGLTSSYFLGDGTYETNGENSTVPGITYGLELGNKWTLYKFNENFSLGLMVDWINIEGGYKTQEVANITTGTAVIDLGFLELGPSFTYALTDKIGLDAYYQIQPTYFTAGRVTDGDAEYSGGFGFTHAFGLAFRYGVLSIGYEPNIGSIKAESISATSAFVNAAPEEVDVNTTRHTILLGFKF